MIIESLIWQILLSNPFQTYLKWPNWSTTGLVILLDQVFIGQPNKLIPNVQKAGSKSRQERFKHGMPYQAIWPGTFHTIYQSCTNMVSRTILTLGIPSRAVSNCVLAL